MFTDTTLTSLDTLTLTSILTLTLASILLNLKPWLSLYSSHSTYTSLKHAHPISPPFAYFSLLPVSSSTPSTPPLPTSLVLLASLAASALLASYLPTSSSSSTSSLSLSTSTLALALSLSAIIASSIAFLGPLRGLSFRVGGHKTFALIHALFLALIVFCTYALPDSISQNAYAHAETQTGPESSPPPSYPLSTNGMYSFLLRTWFALGYFGAGICKLRACWRQQRTEWLTGETMQVYMWLYGLGHNHSTWLAPLREWLTGSRTMCALMAHGGLVFEMVCPLAALLWGGYANALFFAAITGFHLSILVCQGIDFISLWYVVVAGTYLPVVASSDPAVFFSHVSLLDLPHALFASLPPLAALLALAYILVEIYVVVVSTEALMPFTCLSVFARNISLADLEPLGLGVWIIDLPNATDRVDVGHGALTRPHVLALPYKVACLVVDASSPSGFTLLTNADTSTPSGGALQSAAGDLASFLHSTTTSSSARNDFSTAIAKLATFRSALSSASRIPTPSLATLSHAVEHAQSMATDQHGMPILHIMD